MKFWQILFGSISCLAFWGCKWTSDINERKLMSHVIVWDENRKISWEDFKGDPDSDSDANSYFYCGFYVKYYYSFLHLKVKVITIFDMEKSWVRDSSNSDSRENLKWQQLRFDLYEYNVRLFRKELLLISQDSDISLHTIFDKAAACHEAAENSYYQMVDSLGDKSPATYNTAENYVDSLLMLTEDYAFPLVLTF